MGAADEPVIYAGTLVISLLLMTTATIFSGALLGGAFDLMELNHMRYQSMVESYKTVGEGQNYVTTRSDLMGQIDTSSSPCQYDTGIREIIYLNESNVNSTDMEVSIQGHINDCEPIREYSGTSGTTTYGSSTYSQSQRQQINLTYPAIAVAIEGQTSQDSWELVRTYPSDLTR